MSTVRIKYYTLQVSMARKTRPKWLVALVSLQRDKRRRRFVTLSTSSIAVIHVIGIIAYNTIQYNTTDPITIIKIFVYYISHESKTTRNVFWSPTSVCVCVCVSVRGRMPTLLHGP